MIDIFQTKITSDDVVEMHSMNLDDILPNTSVFVFFLDLDILPPGRMRFGYELAKEYNVSNKSEFNIVLAELLGLINSNNFRGWRRPRMLNHGQTPFSINATERCFFVYILNPRHNWEFANDASPFQIIDGKEHYYFHPTKMKSATEYVTGPDDTPDGSKALEGCKLAYFYGKCDEDRLHNGVDAEDGHGKKFTSPFNFYLDLVLEWQNKQGRLRLAVDPDIGHPGGSYP